MNNFLEHPHFWEIILLLAIILNALLVFIFLQKQRSSQFEANRINEENSVKRSQELHEKIIREFSSQSLANEKNISTLSLDFQGKLSESVEKNLKSQQNFQQGFSQSLRDDFGKLNLLMDSKIDKLSVKVQENLDQGFKKTNETFQSVMERLTRIDEAQKKIEQLSSNVVSLQDVLTDKKSRGIFGEVQLNQILQSVFGEPNKKTYQLQYKLKNGTMVDSILFLPEPTGSIPIDSKFPLENFRKKVDLSLEEVIRHQATKDFKKDLKKHIDDISKKYVTGVQETSNQAILFLPAEAIFAEINAYHPEIIDYAYSKDVTIASPTTLLSLLSTIQVVLNNIERNKYADEIHQELNRLGTEFSRYQNRWNNLSKHIDTVNKDIKEIHISTEKITKRFDQISKVEILKDKKEPKTLL